jgi:plastocyanin
VPARASIPLRAKLFLVVAAAAVTAVPVAATVSSASSATQAAAKRVSVRDDSFSPRSITVKRGGKVTWTWRGVNEHNVTFTKVPKGARKNGAGLRARGSSFTRSFTKRGTYRYICTVHVAFGMRGSVIVR